jgi:hypothetical protein
MPVTTPGAFGLIIRKNRRTIIFITEVLQSNRAARRSREVGVPNEDDDLIGLSLAMNEPGVRVFAAKLTAYGASEGEDYVVTSSGSGILGPIPSWLEVSLSPTGNPPELEALMEPEVRAMWERSRVQQYRLAKGYTPSRTGADASEETPRK